MPYIGNFSEGALAFMLGASLGQQKTFDRSDFPIPGTKGDMFVSRDSFGRPVKAFKVSASEETTITLENIPMLDGYR